MSEMETKKPIKMVRNLNCLKRATLFIFALSLTNCQVEDDLIQEQSRIQTVSVNEAKIFLTRSSTTTFSRLSNEKTSTLEYDKITQEKINGSDQLLTVIPYSTNDKTKNERILLLKIDKEIKGVVFSMYPEASSQKDLFSGKLFIYSLEGDFMNGFRVKNGKLITQFVKHNKTTKSDISSRGDGDIDGGTLDEVIITNNYHVSNFIMLNFFSPYRPSGDYGNGILDQTYMWDYYNGGGGTKIRSLDDLENEIANTSPDSFDIQIIQQPNTVMAKVSFNLLPWGAGVQILIDQNKGTQFTIQNVTSNPFGLTLGFSWSQSTFNQSTNGNITTINIYGTLTYNLFAQGIGDIYSSPVTFQVYINNTNGHIISGKRLP
jgi:hypothetical protein